MKIAHVICSLHPRLGGPQALVYRLAVAQAMLGNDVVLAASPDQQADEAEKLATSTARVPKVDSFRVERIAPVGQKQLFLGGRNDELAKLVGWADIVHLHNIWEPIIPVAAREARRAGKPYVVIPNGMLDPWSLAQKKWKKRLAMLLGYRKMLDGAAALHVLNDDEERLIRPLRLKCPGIIVPNGVFLEEITPLPPTGEFRRRRPELRDDPFILFLSRVHYKKGLDHLADAFAIVAKQHPTVRLVVAGSDDGAKADFEARIAAAGLTGRTHVVGPIYGPEKLAALVDAAVFCLPSRQEGFSIAITESLACGLPAVVSDACHFPEVETERAGRVVPLDASRVSEALLEILGDAGKRRAMSEAGQRLISSKYTWPKIAELTVKHYGEILAR